LNILKQTELITAVLMKISNMFVAYDSV